MSSFTLTSPAFEDGTPIPREYGYTERNVNPPLSVSGVPGAAVSLAIVMDDPDALEPTRAGNHRQAVELMCQHANRRGMEPRLTVLTLGVEDIDRSVAFYRDGLGFDVLERMGEFVAFELNGFALALFPRDDHAHGANLDPAETGTGDVSLAHNVETQADVDELIAEAEAAGATITKPPAETAWGGYSAYFRDPDGHLWEVATGAEAFEQFI
ncbi:Glyoxalase/bleomycin resistance protein/dioxygenase [Halorhabdus utahensis DSM 12940]|uniref:Glyoxalase/bleomycin resistance protein/dioxygenase n=1 Tax=Halorhabdus utahensis (strain DSM 12940 / JCM 11049 / AX-2) TaxID=519442 RepID=C7NP65_HALUD|nr:VOC family protein [Halorhabdus utahensis]ACV11652.1 Glyoxalase/bleomycin resistance protein/dioxygenase [Halorhabdus utahensis DSM 12940]